MTVQTGGSSNLAFSKIGMAKTQKQREFQFMFLFGPRGM